MAQYQLFVLPVIALALVVFRNPFDRDVTLSNSWRSRRRRRVLLTRLTVVVLLLATAISEIWPIGDLNKLVQSVIISTIILLPAFAVHWGLLLKQAVNRDRKPTVQWQNQLSDEEPYGTVQRHVASQDVATKHKNESQTDVQDQLERVSDLIQSHDLDVPVASFSKKDADVRQQISARRDQKLASNTALITSPEQPTDLATLDTPQILQLVTTLRIDKKRLQKLVIAQQAAIETERAAHDQTRVVTRDAITIMRSARTAQKHAEKLARRERSERQRLEQQYKKVAHDLHNAMSIIKMRKSAQVADKNAPTARNGETSDGILK